MESDPVISVVIPNFNYRRFVAQAVESVFQQGGSGWEVIVVDDGSTDGSREVLSGFGEKIRLILQENRGPAAARNRGAAQARGEYLLFLDSDDLLLEGALALYTGEIEKNPEEDLLCGDAVLVDQEGGRTPLKAHLPRRKGSPFEALLWENSLITSAVLVKRETFQSVGGFDEDQALRVVEDYDLWLRLLRSGARLRLLGEKTVLKRSHGENISGSGLKIVVPEEALVDKWLSRERDSETLDLLRQKRSRLLRLAAYHARESGDRRLFRHYSWRALLSDPSHPKGWIYSLWALLFPFPKR